MATKKSKTATAAKKTQAKAAKPAKKKTAAKAAAAEKAPKAMPDRTEHVMEVLAGAKTPRTVREICEALKYDGKQAKFVSSILIAKVAAGDAKVAKAKKVCTATGRSVKAYVRAPAAAA